jgi:hypothetical protein
MEPEIGIIDKAVLSKEQSPQAFNLRLAMIVFVGLQCMDLTTTLAVFTRGGVELNPIVHSLIPWMGQVPAVLVSKAILISLGLLLSHRPSVLRFANVLYTLVVAWNLVILVCISK